MSVQLQLNVKLRLLKELALHWGFVPQPQLACVQGSGFQGDTQGQWYRLLTAQGHLANRARRHHLLHKGLYILNVCTKSHNVH
jgi:hypothetical protein